MPSDNPEISSVFASLHRGLFGGCSIVVVRLGTSQAFRLPRPFPFLSASFVLLVDLEPFTSPVGM
jgi:hypothetical protein